MGSLVRRHGFDVALVTVLALLQVMGFGAEPGVGVPGTLLALVAIGSLLVRRRAPLVPALAYLATLVLDVALGLPSFGSASVVVLLIVGVYSAGAYQSLPWALVTLAVWWSSFLVDAAAGRIEDAEDLAFGLVVTGCAFVPGVVARRLRAQAAAAGDLARETADREAARAAQAVADERERIARELHDVVAHAVSIMVVQAAAAEELMERDPARARAALAAVQRTGRTAVGELARMLDLLRGDADQALAPVPTLDALADLAAEARLAGADVAVDAGPLPPLDPGLQLCAYRVVQEALTNAAKHARQPRVRVRLSAEDGDLVVAVDDDGGSGPRSSEGTGHGLVGLRERVEVYGGSLESQPVPGGGFRLRAVLPIGVSA